MNAMSTSNTLALARHWRPRDFQDVIGQEPCCQALTHALDTGRLHHAYLFTGTRGVGKTTLARILAKCLNCEEGVSSKPCLSCAHCRAVDAGHFVDLLEIDAASRTKVEDMRELLDNVQYLPTRGRFKIYLIDEVHMLSGHSFNALLKTLEEPPAHVKFLLATTDPQKLPLTVLSRCLQFHLHPVSVELIVNHLECIAQHEQASYEHSALRLLGQAAAGSVRDALSLLDQALAYSHGSLKHDSIRAMLGLSRVGCLITLMHAVCEGNAARVLHEIHELKRLAKTDPDFSIVLTELLSLLHHIGIAQLAPEALEEGLEEYEAVKALAASISTETLQLYYQIALMGRKDLPYAPDPQMGFEMILLRMVAFRPLKVAPVVTVSTPEKVESPEPEYVLKPMSTFVSEPEPTLEPESVCEIPDWNKVVVQLKLTGLVKALADHCTLAEWSNTFVRLVLELSQKPLLNKRNEEQLQAALSRYIGHTVGLQITVGTPLKETPALQHQRKVHEGQQAAQLAIENDPEVQAMVRRFNAKIEAVHVLP